MSRLTNFRFILVSVLFSGAMLASSACKFSFQARQPIKTAKRNSATQTEYFRELELIQPSENPVGATSKEGFRYVQEKEPPGVLAQTNPLDDVPEGENFAMIFVSEDTVNAHNELPAASLEVYSLSTSTLLASKTIYIGDFTGGFKALFRFTIGFYKPNGFDQIILRVRTFGGLQIKVQKLFVTQPIHEPWELLAKETDAHLMGSATKEGWSTEITNVQDWLTFGSPMYTFARGRHKATFFLRCSVTGEPTLNEKFMTVARVLVGNIPGPTLGFLDVTYPECVSDFPREFYFYFWNPDMKALYFTVTPGVKPAGSSSHIYLEHVKTMVTNE